VKRWAGASFYRYHKNLAGFVDRWVEIHPGVDELRDGWLGWAIENQPDCYLQKPHPELKNSSAYPIEKITARFGQYFTSTVSYMIALAIAEGAKGIGLFGVNMSTDEEYVNQKSCCEYLVGFARGMGIDVLIADGSPLLQESKGLYGYEYNDPFPVGFNRNVEVGERSLEWAI
jgi:hypothetical protein